MELINLPPDLEVNAISKFDKLVSQGELFYEEATWKQVDDVDITVCVFYMAMVAFHSLDQIDSLIYRN